MEHRLHYSSSKYSFSFSKSIICQPIKIKKSAIKLTSAQELDNESIENFNKTAETTNEKSMNSLQLESITITSNSQIVSANESVSVHRRPLEQYKVELGSQFKIACETEGYHDSPVWKRQDRQQLPNNSHAFGGYLVSIYKYFNK